MVNLQMSDALKILYESIKNRTELEYKTFEQLFNDWKQIPLYQNNVLVGCVIQKGNEVHIGYGEKPTFSIRKHLKETLKKVIDEYGYAVTMVMENYDKGLIFCKRLGFYEIAREGSKIILKCDRCKYVD